MNISKVIELYIRLFVDAKNECDVQPILEMFIKKFQPLLKGQEVEKIEPYWKEENVYTFSF